MIDLSKITWHYVNLDKRTDRRAQFEAELNKVGLSANRFSALTLDDYKGPKDRIQAMMGTPPTVGNWMSHIAIWRTVQDTDNIAGTFEDDAMLADDFQWRMNYIAENMTFDWDIFFLGSLYHVNPPVWHKDTLGRDFELTSIKYIHRVYGEWCNHGYLVNGRSVSKLIRMTDEIMPIATGLDQGLILIQPKLNCYCFTPGMAFQRDDYSDVSVAWSPMSNFLTSLGGHCFARRMEDFDYDNYNWAEGAV